MIGTKHALYFLASIALMLALAAAAAAAAAVINCSQFPLRELTRVVRRFLFMETRVRDHIF